MTIPTPVPPRKWTPFRSTVVTAVAVVLFGGSVLSNVVLLLVLSADSDEAVKTRTIVDGDSHQTVAVVPVVTGLMTHKTAETFEKFIDKIEKDDDVKAVVLRIDTPGGEVTAADEMYERVTRFKAKRPGVPVVVSMGGMATSGGYYLACAADYLVAEPTTLTGNIGVLLPLYNFSKLAEKYGVDDRSIHSTGAKFKLSGSPTKPIDAADETYLRGLIDTSAEQFKSVVDRGRKGHLTQPLEVICDGKAFTAGDAKRLGLVDDIGYADTAYRMAATRGSLSKMHVVRYEQSVSWVESLTARSNLKPAATLSVGPLDVRSEWLDAMTSRRPLYYFGGGPKWE